MIEGGRRSKETNEMEVILKSDLLCGAKERDGIVGFNIGIRVTILICYHKA